MEWELERSYFHVVDSVGFFVHVVVSFLTMCYVVSAG
jgi:hypothetical protein